MDKVIPDCESICVGVKGLVCEERATDLLRKFGPSRAHDFQNVVALTALTQPAKLEEVLSRSGRALGELSQTPCRQRRRPRCDKGDVRAHPRGDARAPSRLKVTK